MSETINATAGLSFNLNDIHGFVTGVTYGVDGAIEVFAQAAFHGDDEGSAWRMAHVQLSGKIEDCSYGAQYAVSSWSWITAQDFDRIVGMREIRNALGWRD